MQCRTFEVGARPRVVNKDLTSRPRPRPRTWPQGRLQQDSYLHFTHT